ncbi:metal-dependent hydrolase [Kitasatospora sp. NPDC092039]|uniref:metal-dependent hydrolase n=1 Tax=Kitasatospora sp. NPDC092039 TaxID=3364086 RepID=UPI003800DFDD
MWITVIGLAALGTFGTNAWMPDSPGRLPYAVAPGTLAHLLGDCLARKGAPLLWPHKERYEVVLVKRSGNSVETEVLVPIMSVATFVLLWFTALSPTIVN